MPLNTNCRDEIIPILRALQHVYGDQQLRGEILGLVGKDVNGSTSPKHGRPGLDYWPIVVLAGVRLGCNLDYDKLQNLAESTAPCGGSWASGSGRTTRPGPLTGGGFATT